MAIKSIKLVEEGMTLASAVETDQGQVILPEGIELNDKTIETLKAWGIQEVDIAGNDQMASIDEEELKIKIEEITEKITPSFALLDPESPFTTQLIYGCAQRAAYHELLSKN